MSDVDSTADGETPDADTPSEGAKPDDLTRLREALRKERALSKEYAAKAKQFDELSESQKTEQQRLEERASKAEQQLTPLQAENARLRVALAKGLPADLIDRLRGETVEELEADADTLMSLVSKAPTVGSPDAGARQDAAGGDFNDTIRRQLARR